MYSTQMLPFCENFTKQTLILEYFVNKMGLCCYNEKKKSQETTDI